MIVMRVSTRVVIVLALAAVLVGSGGRSGHASAPGARSSPPLSAGCPAETVRNSALGVTLPLPPGWRDYGFNLSAPGGLFVADPAVHNGKGYPLGIGIGPLGTTSDHDDAHAAATAAERATHGIPFTVTRRPLTIGGAPAILLAPMPGQGPTVGIVLAHHGYLYWVIAFTNQDGDPLRPDQRQALASLRFIPHVGPFPTATVPPPNVPLPTPPSLSLAGAEGSRGAVTVRAWGTGYQPGEAVELQACWTGMPRPGLQLRYTWYWWAGVARATNRGLLATTLTFPVNPAAYTTSRLRVVVTDARIGWRLAAVYTAPAWSPVACLGTSPASTIRSYVAAIARRDLPTALACLTSAFRRQLPPATPGYFGAMQDIVSIRLRTIKERQPFYPLPQGVARGARLFLVSYVGRWKHPLVLENGPHAFFIWAVKHGATAQWQIAAEGTSP